jgi:hypothetical protein
MPLLLLPCLPICISVESLGVLSVIVAGDNWYQRQQFWGIDLGCFLPIDRAERRVLVSAIRCGHPNSLCFDLRNCASSRFRFHRLCDKQIWSNNHSSDPLCGSAEWYVNPIQLRDLETILPFHCQNESKNSNHPR